jgi:hypothetical protein
MDSYRDITSGAAQQRIVGTRETRRGAQGIRECREAIKPRTEGTGKAPLRRISRRRAESWAASALGVFGIHGPVQCRARSARSMARPAPLLARKCARRGSRATQRTSPRREARTWRPRAGRAARAPRSMQCVACSSSGIRDSPFSFDVASTHPDEHSGCTQAAWTLVLRSQLCGSESITRSAAVRGAQRHPDWCGAERCVTGPVPLDGEIERRGARPRRVDCDLPIALAQP